MSDLDGRLLTAHVAQDHLSLVALYAEAADLATNDTARAFYLTQAYVFALETGAPQTEALRQALIAMGSEPPRQDVDSSTR